MEEKTRPSHETQLIVAEHQIALSRIEEKLQCVASDSELAKVQERVDNVASIQKWAIGSIGTLLLTLFVGSIAYALITMGFKVP